MIIITLGTLYGLLGSLAAFAIMTCILSIICERLNRRLKSSQLLSLPLLEKADISSMTKSAASAATNIPTSNVPPVVSVKCGNWLRSHISKPVRMKNPIRRIILIAVFVTSITRVYRRLRYASINKEENPDRKVLA